MVTKKRKTTRRTPSKKRKKKSDGFSFRKWLIGGAVGLFVLAVAGYFLLPSRALPELDFSLPIFARQDLNASIRIILEVGGVKDDEIKVKEVEGVESWMVTLHSEHKRKSLTRGIRDLVRNQNGEFSTGDAKKIDGADHHLVTVSSSSGQMLRILFVVKPLKSKQKMKQQPAVVKQSPPKTSKPAKTEPTTVAEKEPVETPAPAPVQQANDKPMIAIILDDIGQREVGHLKSLLDLKYPVTMAIIPHLPHSAANATYLHQNQYEIMLHMPMQPDNYPKNNPGKGAILAHFNEEEIIQALDKALRAVPFVEGVNNHMGSKITANRTLMRPILQELKRRQLYYIDSRTNATTIAYETAKQMGLSTAERNVFLDAEISYEFTVKQLKETAAIADREGAAIAIGHPHPTTLKALVDFLPKLDKEGYRFVFASELVEDGRNF